MLTDFRLETILERIPRLTLGVLGDLFLDRYLDIDAALTEPSIETGLDAYQVVQVRSYPGAAGTVINNLVALGVKQVYVFSAVGDDGEGYELLQALGNRKCVETHGVYQLHGRPFHTPTYTKPLLHQAGQPPRELNRLDIKNRQPLPGLLDEFLARPVAEFWPQADALIVADQVSEPECGVVTTGMRNLLAELGEANPDKVILADSRERIGLFRSVWLKPNEAECVAAVEGTARDSAHVENCIAELARRAGRPVFCTRGEKGIVLVDPRLCPAQPVAVPAYPVAGPIDSVGAGDSTSAGIACALAAEATLTEAAAFGNLVASITIQQLGTTGTATPEQLRRRWQELSPTR
jgi:bifunctional ADP-heptose synthase (sugar kinase/adenylyltransferase)